MKKQLFNYEKECLGKSFGYEEIWEQGKKTQIDKNGELIGIYVISNLKSNFNYVGSSHNIMQRLKTHISNMKNNKHVNKDISEDVIKYGLDSFEFKILEYCSNSKLSRAELKYLKEYNEKGIKLYNLNELENWNNSHNRFLRREIGR